MSSAFQLHPRLQQDCISIGQFQLCRLLLMNDSQYPWFILVPQIAGISEIYQLSHAERIQLSDESSQLAKLLATGFKADKMNIAAIGNLVPQLHIHHIVRYKSDIAWPAPVWGKFAAVPYADAQLLATVNFIQNELSGPLTFKS
ncbi:HIT domain-containing protein [Crenothrix polyspora]|uniref:Histidine triad (HIT) protein n=1 Tax=Crenothrix polyspora TaxID=360316 RepID=A0A1R4HG38_9GAMM|nr:HIT domain-containing protein [Crenothrix polyspora]SJM95185.1 Histidine triad (HIT) protein [Crenothrix polyspora]